MPGYKTCEFIAGVAKLEQLPHAVAPEIAFAGRSNVGKSSLINALTDRKALARTSNTPGRTQQLNFFLINEQFVLVDMPGYGFAQVSKKEKASWDRLIKAYLRGRVKLQRVFLLIDARRGVLPVDEEMMAMLDDSAVSYQLVLTKLDKLKQREIEEVTAMTHTVIKKHAACHPELLSTSSETGAGIEALRETVNVAAG